MNTAKSMRHIKIRKEIIATAMELHLSGLNAGTSGNLSQRVAQGYLITPTGIPYPQLQAADIVAMDMQGNTIQGNRQASSEWQLHHAIYMDRKEIDAIVHVHSDHATSIACTRQDIPPFHYMIAKAGGNSIPCAEYATFGSVTLAKNAVKALKGIKACLLANHGMLALGADLSAACQLAHEVEDISRKYCLSKQIGMVTLLDDQEMAINLEKFKSYGKQK